MVVVVFGNYQFEISLSYQKPLYEDLEIIAVSIAPTCLFYREFCRLREAN